MEQPIRVGIGLVRRHDRFLIRRRPEGGPMPGVWEFPGGKCEPGEDPRAAAGRECWEETGLEVAIRGQRATIRHQYPHGDVELWYFDASPLDPTAEPAAATGFCWVAAIDLPGLTFPEANGPILDALAAEARRTTEPVNLDP